MNTGSRITARRNGIDPIWWSPVLVVLIAALCAMTAVLFSGAFRGFIPVTVVSDRAGW